MSEAAENTEVEGVVTDAPADNTPSSEDRALSMGWVPKEQFKGDPERWVDHDTFVRRGEEFLPFLKANNKRLESAYDRQSKELEKVKETLAKFAEHHSKTEARAYDRALKDIQERIDQAAIVGDVAGVRAGTEELVDLQKEASTKETAAPQVDPDFAEWRQQNPWFDSDAPMRAATIAMAEVVSAEGYTGKAQIREVDKRIRAEFPHKFENPARRQAAAVEGGGAPPRKAGKTYADLPPDAKAACDDFVKRVPGFTRDRYIKDFFS